MQYFPVCVSLEGKKCLIVGAGDVGRRKVHNLLEYGTREILLLDSETTEVSEEEFAIYGQVRIEQRAFCEQDLEDKFLVFACTGERGTNEQIGEMCNHKGILCNIATNPEKSGFIQPAMLKQGDLCITVSSNGKSPALVKKIKNGLKREIGPEYATFTELLGRLRNRILDLGENSNYNKEIFDSLTDNDILEVIKARDRKRLWQLLQERTPRSMHSNLKEIIDDLL